MCKIRINMSDFDALIRFYLAIFLIVITVATQIYFILIIPIILIFTAIKKRCFIYALLGINKNFQAKFYYKNLFLNTTESIFIFFDNNHTIQYSNQTIEQEHLDTIIENLKNRQFIYTINQKSYKIKYHCPIKTKENLIELTLE